MAKRKTSSSAARTQIIRTPAPIVRVNVPAAKLAKRPRRSFRSGARAVGGIMSSHNVDMAIGGALIGLAVKQGWIDKLPPIPIIGRIGTAAIVLDMYSRRGGGDIARRAASGAAVLAGYQLMQQGHIDGDDDADEAYDGDD